MNTDPELERWQTVWQSDAPAQTDIEERAHRAVRNFRRWIYAEIAVTVLSGGGMTLWAVLSRQPSVKFLAIWVWGVIVAAWLFRFFNDWQNWSGAAVVTDSFVPLLLRRLRANLRAAWFGGVFYFVQFGFVSAWVFRELNKKVSINLREFLLLPANLIFASGTLGFVVWLLIYCRKLNSEIRELQNVQRETGDSVEPSPRKHGALQLLTDSLWNLQDRLMRLLRARV